MSLILSPSSLPNSLGILWNKSLFKSLLKYCTSYDVCVELIQEMRSHGIKPDNSIIQVMTNCAIKENRFDQVKPILSILRQDQVERHIKLYRELVRLCSLEDASSILHEMAADGIDCDSSIFNIFLLKCENPPSREMVGKDGHQIKKLRKRTWHSGGRDKSFQLLNLMRNFNGKNMIDVNSYEIVMMQCARYADMERALELFEIMRNEDPELRRSVVLYTNLITAIHRHSDLVFARASKNGTTSINTPSPVSFHFSLTSQCYRYGILGRGVLLSKDFRSAVVHATGQRATQPCDYICVSGITT